MKIVYSIFIALLFSLPLFGQNFVDNEYADLKDDPENTVVFVSGRLFQMASMVIPEDEEIEELGNVKELAGKVSSFNLVLDRTAGDAKSAYSAGVSKLKSGYEELMTVRDNQTNVSIYVDENDGIIYELVGIGTTDENEFLVFSLTGEIDLDKVGKILSKIENERIDNVITRSKPDIDNMKVYPNPTSSGQVMNIDSPKELIGGSASVYDMNGNVIHQYKIDRINYQLQTNDFVPGKYIIRLQNGEITMQKKVLVIQ